MCIVICDLGKTSIVSIDLNRLNRLNSTLDGQLNSQRLNKFPGHRLSIRALSFQDNRLAISVAIKTERCTSFKIC